MRNALSYPQLASTLTDDAHKEVLGYQPPRSLKALTMSWDIDGLLARGTPLTDSNCGPKRHESEMTIKQPGAVGTR